MADEVSARVVNRFTHVRRAFQLPGLVLASWVVWLIGITLLYALYRYRVIHPHFSPVVLVLALQITLVIAIIVASLRRLMHRPTRAKAVAFLLLGSGPVWLWAVHISYCVWRINALDVRLTLPIKTGAVLGASLADLANRFEYPYRHEGKRVIMWSDRDTDADGDVDKMDRHIARIEQALGQDCRSKVHWIRGGLAGITGRECLGLAFGSRAGTRGRRSDLPMVEDGLNRVDKHEVAHYVINHLCGPDAEPPMLLVEGWAEAHSGYERGFLAERVWKLRTFGARVTIKDLTDERYYGRTIEPMYEYGGAFVDFLLRAYGYEKTFQLYSTCTRASFPDDCTRVLGSSLEELEHAFWADIEQQMQSQDDGTQWKALGLARLATGVDRATWDTFATQHAKAHAKARMLFRQSRFTAETTSTYANIAVDNDASPSTQVIEVHQDANHGRVVWDHSEGSTVSVASPERSFSLEKQEGVTAWTVDRAGSTGLPSYELMKRRMWCKTWTDLSFGIAYLPIQEHPLSGGILPSDIYITEIKSIEVDGRPGWKVAFEASVTRTGFEESQKGWFIAIPEANWTIHSYDVDFMPPTGEGRSESATVQYGSSIDGIPIVSNFTALRRDASGDLRVKVTTQISRCEFKPSPAEEFRPETFGVEPAELELASGIPWYLALSACGCGVSLLLGLVLFVRTLRSERLSRAP